MANKETTPSLADALAETGCADFDQLVAMAKVGMAVSADFAVRQLTPAVDQAPGYVPPAPAADEFPLTSAFFAAFAAEYGAGVMPAMLKISAEVDGHYSGGYFHHVEPQDFAFAELKREQLEQMLADPAVTVEHV